MLSNKQKNMTNTMNRLPIFELISKIFLIPFNHVDN